MVKSAEIEIGVGKAGNGKKANAAIGSYEFFVCQEFMHPMAGKGEDIPGDDQPEKNSEFKPARPLHADVMQAV